MQFILPNVSLLAQLANKVRCLQTTPLSVQNVSELPQGRRCARSTFKYLAVPLLGFVVLLQLNAPVGCLAQRG